jgi:hypothetical protein
LKNVFWDIKTQFVPHRKHITSLVQSPAGLCYVRFEVLTAVTMKNAVFWNVTLWLSEEPTFRRNEFVRNPLRLRVTANIVPSSPILVILMMEAIPSAETSFLTRATRRHIPRRRHPAKKEHIKPSNINIMWKSREFRN